MSAKICPRSRYASTAKRVNHAWNKGKLLGQKPPLKLKEIWAIRIRLQLDHRARELALFNLAIDSKLRGCDLVGLRVHDVVQGIRVAPRALLPFTHRQTVDTFQLFREGTCRRAFSASACASRVNR